MFKDFGKRLQRDVAKHVKDRMKVTHVWNDDDDNDEEEEEEEEEWDSEGNASVDVKCFLRARCLCVYIL